MKTLRGAFTIGAVGVFASVAAIVLTVDAGAQAVNTPPADHAAITGAWTYNADLSDKPPARSDGEDGSTGGQRRSGGNSGGMGGMGRGGRRGGMGRGGSGAAPSDPEQRARMRDAMHDIMTAPAHLTVTQTDTMVLITSEDGRTTRLSPDGSKIKDDSTHIERKTKWDGAKLVSEINGLGGGTIMETYDVDAEQHQLHVTLQTEGGHGRKPMTMTRMYDRDPR
jgi:hypothetical protein